MNESSAGREREWAPILEFPNYMINREGEVRNYKTGRVIKPQSGSGWYVSLMKNGVSHNRGVRGLLRRSFRDLDDNGHF